MPSDSEKDPSVRVVDRRWWARGETAADEAGARKPSYVEELEQRLEAAAAQLQAVAVEHRRALEDFEQAKGRIRRDVSREVERGKRAVLAEFLEVLDNLERALAAAPANAGDAAPLMKGVGLVRDQFLAKLGGLGVTRIPVLGEVFDAHRHEAVGTASADQRQDGTIVAVVRDGYAIGDEVLRPASVIVGKHS